MVYPGGRELTQQQLKQATAAALEKNDLDSLLTLALRDRKVLSVLVRLAYEKDTLIGWRAIIAVGRVAGLFVRDQYEFLRETVRKLLWSLSDESGGIGWSAPEMLGEIVSADPKRLADIVPLIAQVYSIEEDVFRPGVLYALRRIAETDPAVVRPFQMLVVHGLSGQDPLSRIHALELVKVLRNELIPENMEAVKCQSKNLRNDRTEAWIYRKDGFTSILVGELAEEVVKFIE
jgi:hypothetical protein